MTVTNELIFTDGTIISNGQTLLIDNPDFNMVTNGGSNPPTYTVSWVNGTITRDITTNTGDYVFPVGSATKSYLIKLTNNNLTGATRIAATFEPGEPANSQLGITSLNESGTTYSLLCTEGTWDITPDIQPTGGAYDQQLYFNDFPGLIDNQFGIVSRDNHTVAWSLIGDYETTMVVDGYAKRIDCSSFSKKGIGKTVDCFSPSIDVDSIINVSCNGDFNGEIYTTTTGGTAPYTYVWTNTAQTTEDITGLSANTYDVTVTDNNGCTATDSGTVSEPAVLAISVDAENDASCNGDADGSILCTTTGGTTPYSYTWTNTGQATEDINGLGPNTYDVTVTDDNGCTATKSAYVTEPAQLIINLSDSSNITCNGGNDGFAVVTVTGGIPGYSYQWDNPSLSTTQTATGLFADSLYHVTVADLNGCFTVDSIMLSQPAGITSDTTVINATCGLANGSIEIMPSGGTPPFSYIWVGYPSNTDSILENIPVGSYSIIITDSYNCEQVYSVFVSDIGAGGVTVTEIVHNSCYGDTIGSITLEMAGGTPPFIFEWSDGQSGQTAVNLAAGFFSVTVTDSSGCVSMLTDVQIQQGQEITSSIASSICEGDSTYLQNAWQTTPGTYYDTLTALTGCDSIIETTLTVNPLPDVSITGNASFCEGASTTLTAAVSGGATPYSYSWNTGCTDEHLFVSAAGTISLTVTDADGCAVTDEIFLTILPVPQLSVSTTDAACGNNDGSASVSVTGGASPYTYQWTSGDLTDQAPDLFSGTYVVTVTDDFGCSKSATALVNDAGAPVITVSSVTDIACHGGSTGAINVSITGGMTPYIIEWSDGATTEDISGLIAAPYEINVIDNLGCAAAKSINITQPEPLTTTVSTTLANCGNADATAALTVSGGTQPYQYT
ncbi:MAG: SprB repeat-containing protein, partial [Bacteroidetes bacterium]|nr:SprB repeat-containing protein [Bacteroidota bacterium]